MHRVLAEKEEVVDAKAELRKHFKKELKQEQTAHQETKNALWAEEQKTAPLEAQLRAMELSTEAESLKICEAVEEKGVGDDDDDDKMEE